MLHPDDRERVLNAWHESVGMGTPYEQEERHRKADGTYRWFLARGLPLRDSEGRIIRWYGTNTDIEDRKEAEEELEKANHQLRFLSRRYVQVQEDERRRLARELHDQIGQALTAAKISVQSAKRSKKREAIAQHLDSATEVLDGILEEVRQLTLNLRPAALDDL